MQSPELLIQGGDAVITDMDGVVHGDHHGIGLRLWTEIAAAGHWDQLQNSRNRNGSEAISDFRDAATNVARTVKDYETLAWQHMFDFVGIGKRIACEKEELAKLIWKVIHLTVEDHAHDEIIAEITEITAASNRPAIFITNSPLILAQGLVDALFPTTPNLVFSPFTITRDGVLRMAYPEVRINKGAFAVGVMDEYAIDPMQTVGYGDTKSDISLARVVRRFTAVDPDHDMAEYAEANGLRVIRPTQRGDLVKSGA